MLGNARPGSQAGAQIGQPDAPLVGHRPGPGRRGQAGVAPEIVGRPGRRDAAVPDGLRAAQWSTAGVTPATVAQWRAAAIEATEAVTWHELGFSFQEAQQHKAKG